MEVNELPTSNNYGWWNILEAQRVGKAQADIREAQDAALLAHRDLFWGRSANRYTDIVGKMMKVIATFNSNVSLPELSATNVMVKPAANKVWLNGVITLPDAPLHPRTDVWKVVILFAQVLLGHDFVPTDSLFVRIWSRLVNPRTTMALREAFIIALAEVRYKTPGFLGVWSKSLNVEVETVPFVARQALGTNRRAMTSDDLTRPDRALTSTDGVYLVRQRNQSEIRHLLHVCTPFRPETGRAIVMATLPMDSKQRVVPWADRYTQVASRTSRYLGAAASPFQYLIQGLLQKQSLVGSKVTVRGFNQSSELYANFGAATIVIPANTSVAASCPTEKAKQTMVLEVTGVYAASAAMNATIGQHVLSMTLEVVDVPGDLLRLSDFNAMSSTASSDIAYVSLYEDHVLTFDMELDDGIMTDAAL